jgi:hypothetical protein
MQVALYERTHNRNGHAVEERDNRNDAQQTDDQVPSS